MQLKKESIPLAYDANCHIQPLTVFPEMHVGVYLSFKASFFYFQSAILRAVAIGIDLSSITVVSREMRNCRFSVFRTRYRQYHLLPVWCILSILPSRLARAQHCLNHQPFHSLWSGLSVASCVQPCSTGAWGVCELCIVNMDTHMEKNGAQDASTLCSSYISPEGLLKSGWLLVKIVYR